MDGIARGRKIEMPVKNRWIRKYWLLIPILGNTLVFGACSFDYSAAQLAEQRAEEIPQVEIFNVRTEIHRDTLIRLQAERVSIYPEQDIQLMKAVSFQEYDSSGELRLEGQAEEATLYLDTDNVLLQGTIRFLSTVEDAEVESEYLFWDSEAKILTSEGTEVELSRSDGSTLSGTGMVVDGRRNSVSFSSSVRGSYIVGNEEP